MENVLRTSNHFRGVTNCPSGSELTKRADIKPMNPETNPNDQYSDNADNPTDIVRQKAIMEWFKAKGIVRGDSLELVHNFRAEQKRKLSEDIQNHKSSDKMSANEGLLARRKKTKLSVAL